MSPVSTGSSSALSVDYRYIFTDTLTDRVLAELPMFGVTYKNKLNSAGNLSGTLPINDDISIKEVYENTMPGKTSIYVLRNGVCVWGGIISGRTYEVKEKTLVITADEFLSYLDRRAVWKTWSTESAASVEIFEDPAVNGRIIGKITLAGTNTHEDYNLVAGKSKVWISFKDDPQDKKRNYAQYSGQFTVLNDNTYGIDTASYKFFHFAASYKPATGKNFIPMDTGNIDSDLISVRFRMETDDYLDGLLTEHFADDLLSLGFANEYTAPALFTRYDVASYSRSNNVATITTTEKNYFIPGQIIAIRDLPGFSTSRTQVLSAEADRKTFTYAFTGSNVAANTVPTLITKTITNYQRLNNIVTLTTSTDHGFAVEDVVKISGVDNRIDANVEYVISRIGTSAGEDPRVFQFENSGPTIRFSKVDSGATAKKLPIVEGIASGSYIQNSNIGISFTRPSDLKTTQAYQEAVNGAELFTFKEVIDKYSGDLIGFDYRIDVSFNSQTNSFSKEFKFIPLVPPSLTEAIAALSGGVLPDAELPKISYFSVDGRNASNIAFEFPGNIETIVFDETIEEGATRVFVQGTTDVNAPPPFAGAVDFDFLKGETSDGRRWPLYDKVIRKDKMSYANDLYEVARKVVSQAQLPVATFSVTVNGTLSPQVGSYKPGDWCVIRIDDPFISQRLSSYHENKGDTSRNVFLRKITEVSVKLSNNPVLPEEVTLELVTEPGVDITGEEQKWR